MSSFNIKIVLVLSSRSTRHCYLLSSCTNHNCAAPMLMLKGSSVFTITGLTKWHVWKIWHSAVPPGCVYSRQVDGMGCLSRIACLWLPVVCLLWSRVAHYEVGTAIFWRLSRCVISKAVLFTSQVSMHCRLQYRWSLVSDDTHVAWRDHQWSMLSHA